HAGRTRTPQTRAWSEQRSSTIYTPPAEITEVSRRQCPERFYGQSADNSQARISDAGTVEGLHSRDDSQPAADGGFCDRPGADCRKAGRRQPPHRGDGSDIGRNSL